MPSTRRVETWIIDATPLIILAKIGRLSILEQDDREILVTNQVVTEIRRGGVGDPARAALEAGWGKRISVTYIPVAVRALGLLGTGEQSVLTAAIKGPGSIAVLDDEQARKAANALQVGKTGTLGILIAAHQQGRIGSIAPIIHDLLDAGLFLSLSICEAVVTKCGESWP